MDRATGSVGLRTCFARGHGSSFSRGRFRLHHRVDVRDGFPWFGCGVYSTAIRGGLGGQRHPFAGYQPGNHRGAEHRFGAHVIERIP